MWLTVNIILNKRIHKVGEEAPDDEVSLALRKYVYADGDLNSPIPDGGDDGIAGKVVVSR